ncbi:MAG TPA: ABC transporter substrate-binding protein [Nitrososphaeraceae archaeon]|nr:ABC transporter substrate-binding protein [Nitrososphaeraceae archaeon]
MIKLIPSNFFIISVIFFIIFSQYPFELSEQQQQEKEQKELTNQNSYNIKNIRFIHYLDENVALQEIKSGNLDTYFFRIPLDLVSDIKNDVNINLFDKVGGSFGILLNPAPSSDNDTINPFEFRDVRFAINYLINRNFISNEILHGYGIPMSDPFGLFSPDYPVVMDTVESFGFHYDPDYALQQIKKTLIEHGATLKDDKWYFKDTPIKLKVLIRSDDLQRKVLGELVSSALARVGFTIIKDYSDLNKAVTFTQGSDPQDFLWHIYTEGFTGGTSFTKYNDAVVAQMYAPWYANMPGNQNPGFWQYQNSTLDKITQKLVFSNFSSENERNTLLNEATRMGIEESVRIFLVKNVDPYAVSSLITGLVNDFGAGITSKFSLLNAKSERDDSLKIGVKQIYQGAWNNIGGFSDAYSITIYSNIADSATLRHPFTGEVISMRNQILNSTLNGPFERIQIHPDAIIWNSNLGWIPVEENSTSLSKVTYKILYSNWHNGIPMDKSDLLYSLYFMYEWGTNNGDNDLTVDPEYTSRVELGLPYFKGIRFISDDVVESYLDQWHYDNKEIAASAAVWSQEPWEITAASERLVLSNDLSFSKSQSTTKNTEWLSLIIPEHANLIKNELIKMKNENFIPTPLKNIISLEEAKKRYDASIKWIEEHNHALISNGAFYLDRYNPSGRIIDLKLFDDSSYPFNAGYWSTFEKPKSIQVTSINSSKFIKIGEEKTLEFLIQVDNMPPTTPTSVSAEFFFTDYNGSIISQGEAVPINNKLGNFKISLTKEETDKIPVGPATLKLYASTENSLRPFIFTDTFLAIY